MVKDYSVKLLFLCLVSSDLAAAEIEESTKRSLREGFRLRSLPLLANVEKALKRAAKTAQLIFVPY
ncbi:hypothetical protein GFER_00075 [Geoalkalibacter ferrihydriticus DSM 17813]|uniref:Uncharacterized protein n=1 Tax=Geoalkalibacter ferrihydriticus DSM 17813 TaxID=1121915 RepID=A0A0C2HJI4_9BACT|nr:hypothetical protein GFER_00075 [Geoalkalibacter ferrihydriticus DSM 17813]